MYLLELANCGGSGVLKVLLFIKEIMGIIFIIVPIGLIVMMSIDLSKAVIASDAEEMKKTAKIVIKRIIYAIVLFSVPTIVSIFNLFLGELSSNSYAKCLSMASDIEAIEKLEEDEKATALAKLQAEAAAAVAKGAETAKEKANQDVANLLYSNYDEILEESGCDGVVYYEKGTFYKPTSETVPENGKPETKGSADYGYNKYFFALLKIFTSDAKKNGYTVNYSTTEYGAWRSFEHQQELYDCYIDEDKRCNNGNLAALPGTSNHGWGIASDLDYNSSQESMEWAHENAKKYGLNFSVSKENWHIEPLSIIKNDEKVKRCL